LKVHVTTEMSKLLVHIWHNRIATWTLRLHLQQQHTLRSRQCFKTWPSMVWSCLIWLVSFYWSGLVQYILT